MFSEEFLSKLDGKIPSDYIRVVYKELNLFLKDYEVTKKVTDIVPYEDVLPPCYKTYMVTKKIEGKSLETLKQYRFQLERFFYTVHKPVEKISKEDILLFLYQLQSNGSSAVSCDGSRRIINGFFQWCVDNDYLLKNPCKTIMKIRGEFRKRKPLTEMQLEKIRNSIGNRHTKNRRRDVEIRDKALLEFMYSTGARVGEVEKCKISDIDFTTTPPTVSLLGKGNKQRQSYLNAKCVCALNRYLAIRADDNDALFVSLNKPHDTLKKGTILKAMAKYSDVIGEHLYPHKIRHTTATLGLKHGMDITNVQKLLGHADTKTTLIYAEIADEEVMHAHSKYII